MGLTRARVYQLLNEVNDIAVVRWPLGRHQVYELRQKFERESADAKVRLPSRAPCSKRSMVVIRKMCGLQETARSSICEIRNGQMAVGQAA